ncbi:MAG: hypothetical protein AAGF97_07420 [Planctomycetota bacterium]
MMMTVRYFCLAAVCVVGASTVWGDVFLDQGSYDAAVGSSIVPDYANLAPIEFPLGTTSFYGFFDVTSAGGPGTPQDAADYNAAENFVFDFDPANLSSVTFTLPTPAIGIAGFWSNTFVQDGFRVSTPFNTYDLNSIADPLSDTFIGITEDMPFDTVVFSTSQNIPGDDFVFFNGFSYAPVPEPAGGWGLVFAGGLVGLLTRRKP